MTSTFKYSLDQQDDGWDYRQNFEMVATENTTQQQKRLFKQHIDGVFLLNQNGVISKSSGHSEINTGTVQNVGIANTVFTLDSNQRLTNATHTSSIRYDNAKTIYEYDDMGRLKPSGQQLKSMNTLMTNWVDKRACYLQNVFYD